MHRTTFEEQQQRIVASYNGNQPEVQLIRACTPSEGIVILSDQEKQELQDIFLKDQSKKTFFVPSSGSGSRMFQFLFDFISEPNETNRGYVERFLNHIEDFAFFNQFPLEVQKELRERSMSIDQFVAYILNNKGMGLAHLPKGLIPFHKYGPFILNPFQEHVLQGRKVCGENVDFHFTVTKRFESEIEKHLDFMYGMTGHKSEIKFSAQDPETDAYAFHPDGSPADCENGEQLRRPAGHGALLENMYELDADLIFVKNIDNVQHINHSDPSIETHRILAGCLLKIQTEIKELLENWSDTRFDELNTHYQLFDAEHLAKLSKAEKMELLRRPTRVCGMVRNEGQPGGGPFWINDNGIPTKQIVEKAQISMSADQYRVMIQSTHFNPVLMVCQGKHFDGSSIDFEAYRDNEKYFIVNKKYQGKDIRFTELPGLWNGSMAYWNSVFVEVSSEAFSPVKTILDLLEAAHQN
jgi:hypothetical protein